MTIFGHRAPYVALVALAAVALVAGSASAQFDEIPASPNLPWDHWSVLAVDRLEQLGLVTDWLPAQREAPLLAVEAALAEAERRAPEEAPEMAALVAAWHSRFLEEWRGATEASDVPRLLGGNFGAGYDGRKRGLSSPASTSREPWAVDELSASSLGRVDATAAATAGTHLAALASPELSGRDLGLARGEIVAGAGPLALSVGRAPVRYGFAQGGAVLLSGNTPLDRVELSTSRLVRLPGILSWLGVSADGFIARLDEPRHGGLALVAGASLQFRPHPRFTIAGQRAVMFGGPRWTGADLGDALLSIAALKNYNENNLFSGSFRYRIPTEHWVPLTAYAEWGTDDNIGAAVTIPGLVAGLSIPALPTLPQASAGLEFSFFGRACCRDITWYSHGQYTGGWATGETPLGHPLGGNGREYRAYASLDALEARLRLRGDLFLRQRFSGNLYSPDWAGASRGLDLDAALRLARSGELAVRASWEVGSGWSTGSMLAEGRVFF